MNRFLAQVAGVAIWVLCAVAAAADPLILAPGKSVTVVNGADPSMRVVIAAPADAQLDLDALFRAGDPTDTLESLLTRSQVRPATAVVRNADGSTSLGAPGPAASSKTIEGGVIVFIGGGNYRLESEVPDGSGLPGAAGPQLIGSQDRSPLPPVITNIRTR